MNNNSLKFISILKNKENNRLKNKEKIMPPSKPSIVLFGLIAINFFFPYDLPII